jgi:hypothetical protein
MGVELSAVQKNPIQFDIHLNSNAGSGQRLVAFNS